MVLGHRRNRFLTTTHNTVVRSCLVTLECLFINITLLNFRHFNLRMKRDTSLFAQDLKVDVSGEEIPYDTSHIYTGEIYGTASFCISTFFFSPNKRVALCFSARSCVGFSGEKGTLTHGAIVDGKFEGFIQSYQGTYYVEPAERYLEGKNVPFHSVIYHEDDIRESSAASATPIDFQAFFFLVL